MPRRSHRQQKNANRVTPPKLSAGAHQETRLAKSEFVCWALLFAAALGALIWNHHAAFFYSISDEQIHFYVARRMAEGAVLYRDIDSARPPLVLFPIALLIRIGVSPLLAGRAMVLVTQIATAGLLLWGGWRLVSWRTGNLAALLFLTSPEVFSRIHYTGIHLVALFTFTSVLFCLRAQPLRSGLFFGLSLAAGQHGLVIGGVLGLLIFIRSPREGARFVLGASIVTASVFGTLWAVGARHVWQSLFGHHLYHLASGQTSNAQLWEKLTPWFYEHGYMFVGAGLAFALLGFKRRNTERVVQNPSSRIVRVLLLLVGVHLAFVMTMSESVFLYIVVIAPLLCLLAAMGYAAALAWWRESSQLSRIQARRASRLILTGLVAVMVLTAGGWAAARSHREKLDDRQYSFWPQVLHGQVSRYQQLDISLRAVTPTLTHKGTIFGDPSIVSVLALNSGLRISGDLVDINPVWIEAGTVKGEDVVSRIEDDGISEVITPPFGLVHDPYFKSYLFACYERPKPVFPPESGPGAGLPFFMVFTHKQAPCQVPTP